MPSMIILLIIWKKLFQSGPQKFVGKFPDEVALRRNKNFCQKMHLPLACQYGVPQNQTGSWACGMRIIHNSKFSLTTWVAVKKITKSPFLPLGAAQPEPGRTMTHGLVKHLKSFVAVHHGRQRNPQDHAILRGVSVRGICLVTYLAYHKNSIGGETCQILLSTKMVHDFYDEQNIKKTIYNLWNHTYVIYQT